MIERVRKLYLTQPWDRKIIMGAALVSLVPILAAVVLHGDTPAEVKNPAVAGPSVDTFIPKGFVLVPVEVQNYESLDSILGKFGTVDLFESGQPGQTHRRLVARNVRLLRAPQNPTHFAILVQESEVSEMLRFGSQFTVILKRPGQDGTELVKGHHHIVYE